MEIIVAMAIAAIVLAAATPSFSAMLEKQRLDGASSRLVGDIHFARSEAALRGERVRLGLHGTLGGCYLISTGSAAACTCSDEGSTTCVPGATPIKTVAFGVDTALRLTGNVGAIVFDPLHGTSSPGGTLTLTAGSGRSVRHVVSLMGSVRTCSPSAAAPAVAGYAIC